MDEQLKQHGAFSWNELLTTDPEAAKRFYRELFNWVTEEMAMQEGGNYTVVKVGGKEVGGMMQMPPEAGNAPPHWGAYVTVDNVDATVEKAQQLGGSVIVPPRDIPEVGRFSVLQDPQGAVISVITYLESV